MEQGQFQIVIARNPIGLMGPIGLYKSCTICDLGERNEGGPAQFCFRAIPTP
jgi:hypothetical protein